MREKEIEVLNNSVSTENKFLEGFFASKKTNNYFLGVNFAVAKSKKTLSHLGSTTLDEIKVFDLAETGAANIGQINMMIVSSFCGPKGLIWGYDVCKIAKEENEWNFKHLEENGEEVKIYKIENLVEAFKRLTGTVKQPRFPFLPGSHVPCACKKITAEGENIIYTALGIGIPKNRDRNACLLMEDIGKIPLDTKDIESYKKEIIKNLVKSVIKIGKNQNVEYKEIFVGIKAIKIEKGEIGCALVAAPYFTLAKDGFIKDKNLTDISIEEWENLSSNNFLSELK